jgi:uncharacterized protein YqjF (DUF2071 family)
MAQNWHDLLFAHWQVPAEELRRLIPERLQLDIFEGKAWIGIVPFTMSGVRSRCTPPIPGFSSFPELNVRTYVTAGGKPGVWFFSLDAGSRLAVEAARFSFCLPYFYARMKAKSGAGGTIYSSQRKDWRGGNERLQMSYRESGAVFEPQPGSLEYFLTERYCLYASRPDGQLLRGEIHHAPWRLQEAQASFTVNTMTESLGVKVEGPAILHYAKLQEMIAWAPYIVRK